MLPDTPAIERFLTLVRKASLLKPGSAGHSAWFRLPIGEASVVAAEISAMLTHAAELEKDSENTQIAADGGSLRDKY